MKKLALNIEEIEVESFDTLRSELRRGTVAGREDDSAMGTGCNTDDMCCQANTYGGDGGCDSSGDCDDLSACWGGIC
ncbi:MAG TPA: hypothetical protein VHG91_08275 [Longimicrobium sp.]|nr:hypothetical protein [Longimicrobium sp.]